MRPTQANDTPCVQDSRRKPGLDERHAPRRKVTPEADQRARHPIERDEVANGTEQTQDCIVSPPESEVAHVGLEELAGRMFLSCEAKQAWIEVEAVDLEAMTPCQQP